MTSYRYSKRTKRRTLSDINIVPYIDVMLVLLMVFMITTPLLNQSVKVQLPKTKAQAIQKNKQKPIIVTVNKAGQYYLSIAKDTTAPLNQTELTSLMQKALAHDPARNIYVRGDNAANYGSIVKAMAILQQAGANHVGLLTQAKP